MNPPPGTLNPDAPPPGAPQRVLGWLGRLVSPRKPPLDTWALWHRACAGEQAAAQALVRQLTPQALGLAWQLLRQPADAEDAVQDAFVRLWASRPSDAQGASLATYFNTIVLNRCRSLLLRQRELATDPDELTLLSDARQPEDTPPWPAQLPAGALQAALQALPARQRMALAMWAYADADVAEIARALDLPTNAAHQLLHRAKQGLKQRLAPPGDTR